MIKPKLFECIKDYNSKTFISDLVAGIVVAIIALPLSIALAIASGVGPNEGLYTAIVAGFFIAFFGGSRVQISGPTAAFSTIVANIIIKDGMEALVAATAIAGLILIIFGVLRLGRFIEKLPSPIITGFTAGIAATIAIGQIKDFCGISYIDGSKPISALDKVLAFISNIGTINVLALVIGIVSIIIIVLITKLSDKVPGSFIAILITTFIVIALRLNVLKINDLYSISNEPMHFHLPSFSVFTNPGVYINGFIIAILAAIESLLSCVVSDKMIKDKSNSDAELIGQGIGNILSVLFGGIPATGAIARTTANVKNGGKTPVAGIIHALVLFLMLVGLMKYVGLIPMPTIAALLLMVAYNMSQLKEIQRCFKQKSTFDLIILFMCFFLTIFFNLVVGIFASLICYIIVKKVFAL